MTGREPAAAENAALRARISALGAASVRISASLDLETVLNGVVESARALTGARYGAIATIDEAGERRHLGLHRGRAPEPGGSGPTDRGSSSSSATAAAHGTASRLAEALSAPPKVMRPRTLMR